ncbi:hypothetical protein AXG93_4003s1320 [Marchantia polymorpha subsp. ruderalis]|uniref:Uncharacterized protein n=1 Tax=Marchantia polymorpha subsp. ruderalis TaxID=1480154 RepID=A0A176W930_MARPO|nr:hypothetical protein AXG93_4003s1320 [Marchantia polymorpha subsp. ruderalis]
MSEEELLEGKKLLLEGKKLLLDVKKLLLVGFCTLPSLSDSDCTLPSLSYLEKRMSDVKKQVSDALDLLDGTDYIIAIARIQETFLRVYTAWPKEIEELKNIFFHGLPFDFDFDRNRNLPKSTVRGAGHGGKMSTVINWDRILGKYEERTIVLNWEDESTFFSPLSVYFLKMELSGLKKELSDLKDMSIFKDEQLFDATDVLDLLDQLKALYIGVTNCRARFEETVSTARPPSDFPNLLRDVDNRLGDVDTLMKKTSYHFEMGITYEYLRMSEEELLEGKKLYLRMSEEELLEGKKLLLDVKKLLLVGFCTLPSLSDSDCTLPSLSYLEKRMSDVKKQVSDLKDKQLSDALDLLDGTDYIIAIAMIRETFLWVYTAWPRSGLLMGITRPEERINFGHETRLFFSLDFTSLFYLVKRMSDLKKQASDLNHKQLLDALDLLDETVSMHIIAIISRETRVFGEPGLFGETVYTARPPSDLLKRLFDLCVRHDEAVSDTDLVKETGFEGIIFFHGLPFDFDFDFDRNLPKSTKVIGPINFFKPMWIVDSK